MTTGEILANLLQRDFSTYNVNPRLMLSPRTYSQAVATAGPERASVDILGDQESLWDVAGWLRCPLEITDPTTEKLWWGFVKGIAIRIGAIQVGIDITGMSNRIAVAYTDQNSNRATTGWSQDDNSVATYGTKELLASLSTGTDETAEALRDVLLGQLKYPIPTTGMQPYGSNLAASLECRGWWDTLDWKYYSQSAGQEGYTEIDPDMTFQAIGDVAANTYVAQGFQVSDAWELKSFAINVNIEGTPTDSLEVKICADSGGNPGTVLGTVTILVADLGTSYNWVWCTLSTPISLAASTPYWIAIARSGVLDATNYYRVTVNEDLGYASGVLKIWNTSAWVARSPDADMNFQLIGERETTQQVSDIITAAGQFITGIKIETDSGINAPLYRAGDNTALAEIMQLLRSGTSAGKRLIPYLTSDRVLRIYAEPSYDPTAPDYFMGLDGVLVDRYENPVKMKCPIAKWVQLRDVIPASLDVSRLADFTAFFIDQSEYNVNAMTLTTTPRGVSSPWDIGGMDMG